MKRILTIAVGVLALVVVAVGAVGASAVSAQEDEQAGAGPWWPPRLPRMGRFGSIDFKALLADALGITTDELASAHEQAREMALEQAIEEGIITQEQADKIEARKQLATYIDRKALLAEAMGMTAEELAAALADEGNLADLMEERGLEAAAVFETVKVGLADALSEAVADGVITQEQADRILSADTMRGLLEWQRGGRRRMPRSRRFGALMDRERFEGQWFGPLDDDATDTGFAPPLWIPKVGEGSFRWLSPEGDGDL